MVFEQSYNIKIKVVGKSTMQMEGFENSLHSLIRVYGDKSNVAVTLTDSKGENVTEGAYSFVRYANGFPWPEKYLENSY
jgi:hypothetical protein